LVTTTDGATVTPVPNDSPPSSRSTSTLTTLPDSAMNGTGLGDWLDATSQ
jgi:hypothetical protein